MATENLLVEIGTEELPPKALRTLGEALRDGIVDGLAQRELGHGEVRWFATPRRLAVQIADVQLAAADREQEALGPPLERARDEAGNWTPAAAGFAKKQGVDPADLEHIDAVTRKNLVYVPMSEGDVVLVDNYQVMHGRDVFEGTRLHAVTWFE